MKTMLGLRGCADCAETNPGNAPSATAPAACERTPPPPVSSPPRNARVEVYGCGRLRLIAARRRLLIRRELIRVDAGRRAGDDGSADGAFVELGRADAADDRVGVPHVAHRVEGGDQERGADPE